MSFSYQLTIYQFLLLRNCMPLCHDLIFKMKGNIYVVTTFKKINYIYAYVIIWKQGIC